MTQSQIRLMDESGVNGVARPSFHSVLRIEQGSSSHLKISFVPEMLNCIPYASFL